MTRFFFFLKKKHTIIFFHQLIFGNKNVLCCETKQTLVCRENFLTLLLTRRCKVTRTPGLTLYTSINSVHPHVMQCYSQDSSVSNSLTISSQCLSSPELHRLLLRKTSSHQTLVSSENDKTNFHTTIDVSDKEKILKINFHPTILYILKSEHEPLQPLECGLVFQRPLFLFCF